jgi:large subunit ribosomal protein L35
MAGNKMKTRRGAAKRFSRTSSGKIKFKRANMRHILAKKDQKAKRHLRHSSTLCSADAKLVSRLIPYK